MSDDVCFVKLWEPVSFTSGPFHNFDTSQDILGDGSVILLPTPGHDPGHLVVLVRMDGYEILITGDIMYTLRHSAVDEVRAIQFGEKFLEQQQIDSVKRLHQLRQTLPNMVFVPGHDHTDYQYQLLEPLLADGFSPLRRGSRSKPTKRAYSMILDTSSRARCLISFHPHMVSGQAKPHSP